MASIDLKRLAVNDAVADVFLAMCGEGLKKKSLKDYLVLERKLNKSDQNKNAISFIREGVSFMVRDWSSEEAANTRKLRTIRSRTYRRLIFPDLTLKDVTSNPDFFTMLIADAKLEAEHLQSMNRKN